MYRKYHGFLHFFTSSSQSKPTKNTGIYSVLTRQHAKKNNVFKQFSTNFQLVHLHKKRSFFTPFLPPFIRTQEGAKSGQIAKLNLTSTFCLSQSLPQSCSPKNWGRLSGPQNAVNYGVLWTYHAFYMQNKWPPPPPERHALLRLRCGRIYTHACNERTWSLGLEWIHLNEGLVRISEERKHIPKFCFSFVCKTWGEGFGALSSQWEW